MIGRLGQKKRIDRTGLKEPTRFILFFDEGAVVKRLGPIGRSPH